MDAFLNANLLRYRRHETKQDIIVPLEEVPTFRLLTSSRDSIYTHFVLECYNALLEERKKDTGNLEYYESAFAELFSEGYFSEENNVIKFKGEPIDFSTSFVEYYNDIGEDTDFIELYYYELEQLFIYFEPFCYVIMYFKQYFMQDKIEKAFEEGIKDHYEISDKIMKDMQDPNFDWSWYDSPILYRDLEDDFYSWWSDEHREVDILERSSFRKNNYENTLFHLLAGEKEQENKQRKKNLQEHGTDVQYFIIAEDYKKTHKHYYYPTIIYDILTADFFGLQNEMVTSILDGISKKLYAPFFRLKLDALLKKNNMTLKSRSSKETKAPSLQGETGIPRRRLEYAYNYGLEWLTDEEIKSIAIALNTTTDYLTQP